MVPQVLRSLSLSQSLFAAVHLIRRTRRSRFGLVERCYPMSEVPPRVSFTTIWMKWIFRSTGRDITKG